jgi:hypothetical protein
LSSVQSAVLDGLIGTHHSELGVRVHFAGLLAVDEILGVEPLHLAGETRLELGGVEAGYGRSSATAAHQALPVLLEGVPEGSERAQTGDDHTSELHPLAAYFAFFST